MRRSLFALYLDSGQGSTVPARGWAEETLVLAGVGTNMGT